MHKHAHTCTHALHSYICVFSLHHVNNFSTNQAYMHRGIFLNMSKSCKYEVGFLLNVKKKCYSYLLRLSLVRVRLLGSSCAKLLNASSLNLFPERFKSFKTYHTKNHERNEMKVCHNWCGIASPLSPLPPLPLQLQPPPFPLNHIHFSHFHSRVYSCLPWHSSKEKERVCWWCHYR